MTSWSDKYCDVHDKEDNTRIFKHLELHHVAWICAGFCAAVACILSFYLIYKHCTNYTCPIQQKHIVRILLMVPIYSIDSFLSFRFYWLAIYFDIARDCYEAFVIYTFYSLLLEYVGGYREGKELFATEKPFKMVYPLCCCFVEPKRGLLRQCKRLTLQYVIIRPTMTLLAIALQRFHQFCPGNFAPVHGYLYFSFINFVSVTVAMYALVQFYSVSKKHIAKYKPIPKFLSVKFVIFLSFWQQLVVSGAVTIHIIKRTTLWSTDNIATGVENTLLCGEMLIAAIWHISAFDYHDFVIEGQKTSVFESTQHCFNPYDIAQDIYNSFFPKKLSKSRLPSSSKDLSKRNTRLTMRISDCDDKNDEKNDDDKIDDKPEKDVEMRVRSGTIDAASSVDKYVDVPLSNEEPPIVRTNTDKYVDLSYKSDASDDEVSLSE